MADSENEIDGITIELSLKTAEVGKVLVSIIH